MQRGTGINAPTRRNVFEAVRHAVTLLGVDPAAVPLMLAQIWYETAGGRALWSNNVGNITAGSRWSGAIWRPSWYEIDRSAARYQGTAGAARLARDERLHTEMLAGRAPAKFRAYPSLRAGALDYVRQLRGTFPSLLRAMRTGDTLATALAIDASGYCPDCPVETSRKALARLVEPWRAWIRQHTDFAPYSPAAPGGGNVAALLVGAAVVAIGLKRWSP